MTTGKSSGIVIGIIGIIIGAAGVGIGGYAFVTLRAEIDDLGRKMDDLEEELEEKSSVQRTWYIENLDIYYTTLEATYDTLPYSTITFSLRENEVVYFLFTGRAYIWKKAFANSYISVQFIIDGVRKYSPYSLVGGYNLGASYVNIPVVLQHSNDTLSIGTHTVSMSIFIRNTDNSLSDYSLLVQTYIP